MRRLSDLIASLDEASVVRKLVEADEPALGLVNHILLGVSQIRTASESEASRRRRAR